jgi:rhodanese-related sulfurtransferase
MSIIHEISPEDLYRLIREKQVMLIDVREPSEFSINSIEGALNIPLSGLLREIYTLDLSSNTKIVLQCAAGVRSMLGCQLLAQENFPYDLYNLRGGIIQWHAQHLPLKVSAK